MQEPRAAVAGVGALAPTIVTGDAQPLGLSAGLACVNLSQCPAGSRTCAKGLCN